MSVVHRACGHCWSSVYLCQYPMAVINYIAMVGQQFCLYFPSCYHCHTSSVCCSSCFLWSLLVFCLSLSVSYGCHQYVVMVGYILLPAVIVGLLIVFASLLWLSSICCHCGSSILFTSYFLLSLSI